MKVQCLRKEHDLHLTHHKDTLHIYAIPLVGDLTDYTTKAIAPLSVYLTCNVESAAWHLYPSYSCYIAFHYCSIQPGIGSELEGGGPVCKNTVHITDICEGGLIVKVRTLHNRGGIITDQNCVFRWGTCELKTIHRCKKWFCKPLNSNSLDHTAGEGHHLPRTGCLSPINTGIQGDSGCI